MIFVNRRRRFCLVVLLPPGSRTSPPPPNVVTTDRHERCRDRQSAQAAVRTVFVGCAGLLSCTQKRLVVSRTRRPINDVSRSTKQTGAERTYTVCVFEYHSVVILAGSLYRIVWAALNVERKREGTILSQRWKMSRCLKGGEREMTHFSGCCVGKQRRISVHFNCKTGFVSFFSSSFHDLHNFRKRYLEKKTNKKKKYTTINRRFWVPVKISSRYLKKS